MELKNLTKKLTTLAITALMATTLVSTQNVLAASKKAQKKANKAYAQAIKKNKVARFTSYSLIEVTGGGTKELVAGEEYGIVMENNSVESIYEALEKAAGNTILREKGQEMCYNRLKNKFTWEKTVDELERLVEEKDFDYYDEIRRK